jgi:hypothetical protein
MALSSSGVRFIVTAGLVFAAVAVATRTGEAHKPITSKYTYNDDVFPIVRDKCGRCHVEGGVAPMSLMTYEEAFPWAESIRAELIASHMPPWNADEGFGEIKRAHRLTATELDVILTWATGGNPRGELGQSVPKVTLRNDWPMGPPDVKLPLPSDFTLVADKMEDTGEFTLPTGTTEPRWVRAVDLLPGTPSIVRSAVIYVKDPSASAAAPAPERVLARWLPGQDPDPMVDGTAFRLPAGAQLGVRIHYRKTWQFEGKPLTDRSTVGVYFATEKSAQELLTLPVAAPANAAPKDETLTFSQTIDQDVQVLALSPDQVPANITLQVQAVRPDGSRTPMIRLNTRADWGRRYWFEKPITLPRGTKIEVVANLEDPDLLSSAFSVAAAPKPPPSALPMRLALDVIPATAKPAAP